MLPAACTVGDCRKAVLAREMCKTHYHRWHRHGDPTIVQHPVGVPVEDRFWLKAEETPGGCWSWHGKRNRDGYGLFKLRGSYVVAHRVAYELMVSDVPSGLELDHLCRVRCCVNPYHLEPVTHGENMRRASAARQGLTPLVGHAHGSGA